MDFGQRTEIFRALVGSYNYNLNTKDSDKDYKVFITPDFDDLYFNKQFSKCYIGETVDYDIHDIRKVCSLWWKANVNFLEVLFSEEFIIGKKDISFKTKELVEKIHYYKDYIARMNLPYLYKACIGMHTTKKKQIDKGTESTQKLVEKYGFDTKQAMHSIRILDFLKRFADNDFKDFKSAIWYNKNDPSRDWLLDIKNGKYSKVEFMDMSEQVINNIKCYEKIYKSQEIDEEMNNILLNIIKEIVKIQLF